MRRIITLDIQEFPNFKLFATAIAWSIGAMAPIVKKPAWSIIWCCLYDRCHSFKLA
jgi:hypothetical protein